MNAMLNEDEPKEKKIEKKKKHIEKNGILLDAALFVSFVCVNACRPLTLYLPLSLSPCLSGFILGQIFSSYIVVSSLKRSTKKDENPLRQANHFSVA